jgi:hypothetical protein
MTIEFTEQEGQALLQLIDIAVKSGGLNVAQAGVILASKISEAAKPKTQPETQDAP